MNVKDEYLVALDYGQGGVWAFVRAESEAQIGQLLPEVQVVHERPDWLTPDEENRIRERMSLDIGDAAHPFMLAILRARQ